MSWGRWIKHGIKAAIPPLVFLAVVGYFGWQATRGSRGLEAYAVRERQLVAAQDDLARVQTEQAGWERRVAALRMQHLDPDMLDERARAMLNVARPIDIVIPYGPGKRLF